MKLAIDNFDKISSSTIFVKIYKNEMIILHNSNLNYNIENFSFDKITESLKGYLNKKDFVTLNLFSDATNIKNQILAKVLIEEMLEKGFLCIDESDIELRYFYNKILFNN
jgi:hypothetical protein